MNPFDFFLVDPMTNFLVLLTRLLFGSYGLAIIAFTLIMRIITWPLTASQIRSSRQLSALQPKLQEIQKKYKDPKRRSEETMKLYREAGVNPAGCLFSMVVQMPIWFALYQSIRNTLGGTPEALVNLSQDLYPWSFLRNAVPLNEYFLGLNLGEPDPIVAILVAASFWVQQKILTPPTQAMDPQQQATQQTMQWMMPLMFGYIAFVTPSGLGVYWVVTAIISVAMQYFLMGRQLDWRNLFSLSTAAPAPAARGRSVRPPEREEEAPREEAVEAARTHPPARRRRHGRRRGKR